jgi:hypothetical protein
MIFDGNKLFGLHKDSNTKLCVCVFVIEIVGGVQVLCLWEGD